MFDKVAFTMYVVKDLARARKFYEETLGFICSKESAGGKWIEYDLPGGGCFCLTNMAEGVSPSDIAGGSIAFEVKDIKKLGY